MSIHSGRIGHQGCLVPVEVQAAAAAPGDRHGPLTVGHFAQIDTGAPVTLLASRIAELLNLPPIRMDVVETRYGEFDCLVYNVTLDLLIGRDLGPSTERRRLATAVDVFEFECLYEDYSIVVGRDVVSALKIELDGPGRSFRVELE